MSSAKKSDSKYADEEDLVQNLAKELATSLSKYKKKIFEKAFLSTVYYRLAHAVKEGLNQVSIHQYEFKEFENDSDLFQEFLDYVNEKGKF